MGFEFPVRVCDSCYESITEQDGAPTTTFHDNKQGMIHMHYEPFCPAGSSPQASTGISRSSWLLTSGIDRVIKLWDMSPVVS
ncbi:hypothetical protein AALO_G00034970 [Alosa alosa]|uniref:Uncharacterized protein n=1 Tax=Alosa alosa TaxID=278164 RepID=A0AAV6H6E4_9TELE|nr:hypothetical protein AALO_G00034970 [Alosa alosa]